MIGTKLRTLRYRLPRPREAVDRALDRILIPYGDYDFVQAGPAGRRAVALTFDDGPSLHTTPRLLELLRANGAKATFFVVGEQVEAHPDVVARIAGDGHEIGNHTFSHPHSLYLAPAALRDEIVRTNDAVASVYPRVRFVRPPYGKDRRRTATLAGELGMRVALWSVDSGDASEYTTDEIVETVLEDVEPGAIVLLHDGGPERPPVLEACARLLPVLREQGYELTTLSELLEDRTGSDGRLAPERGDLARQ